MSLNYLLDPNNQFRDRNGRNNVNGFIRVYIDGTDDFAPTYRNFDGTLNPRDIRIDNNGRCVIIVDDSKAYRVECYDRDGGLLWTQHPVMASAHNIIIDSPDESINVDPHVDPGTGALVYSLSTNIVEMTTDEVTEVVNDFNY